MVAPPSLVPDWIAVDWSATQLRATLMGADGPSAHAHSADGIATLPPDAWEPALLRLIAPWLIAPLTQVVACGMAGATLRPVPCAPVAADSLIRVQTCDNRIAVHLAPGLSQAAPADVMYREAVQIAGALAVQSGFDGVICLPGSHTKWAHISAGEVVSFQSFMTGEIFTLLSTQSVLQDTIAAQGFDAAAFDAALSDALSNPEKLAARLFSLRAQAVLGDPCPVAARSRLSGLLIGIELAAAKPYWLGQPVILIGAPDLCAAYGRALGSQGVSPSQLGAAACTLAGLSKLQGAL